jgi:hypothetical protein
MCVCRVHTLRQADTLYYIRYVYYMGADGEEIFYTRLGRPWGPPSILYNGYRGIPGDKAAGAWC